MTIEKFRIYRSIIPISRLEEGRAWGREKCKGWWGSYPCSNKTHQLFEFRDEESYLVFKLKFE